MTQLPANAIELLAFLLPGFAAAWIFYGLTSHAKPSQFERVVQALIFTFVIQAFLPLLRAALLTVGEIISLAPWGKESEILGSLVLAISLGGLIAYWTNNDSFHKKLRSFGFTSRTSHPSEWFCTFTETVTYVILHLKDGRRLYGWPKEWPIDPHKGQFYIQVPSWIDADANPIDLPQLDGILVHVNDVEWVEFMRLEEQAK